MAVLASGKFGLESWLGWLAVDVIMQGVCAQLEGSAIRCSDVAQQAAFSVDKYVPPVLRYHIFKR